MVSLRPRRLAGALAALLVGALLSVPTPSQAASHDGVLHVKGPGSTYSGPLSSAILAVGAGATATYGVKVLNAGSSLAQFRVNFRQRDDWKLAVYAGSFSLTPLAASGDGYYTKALAPGASEVLTVKITAPVGAADLTSFTEVNLWATDDTHLSAAYLGTVIKAPAKGTSPVGAYARNGSQPFVGGANLHYAAAPPVALGGTFTYQVKLQNDGSVGHRIKVAVADVFCGAAFPLTVKDSGVDVTAGVKNGTYQTPVLAAGAARTLVATVKNQATSSCPFGGWRFLASDLGGSQTRSVGIYFATKAS